MWLHVPINPTFPSAQEPEPSTLELSLLGLELEQRATWRGMSLRPQSWRRVLRQAGFRTLLSGLTYSRSTAEAGVASWMASLAVSPVNPTALQESGSGVMTPETSGLSLRGWYGTLRRAGSSSKTSQASLITTFESYDPTLKTSATRLRKESSQRRRSARLIFGSASSGSQWQTASVADTTGGHLSRSGERSNELMLRGQAKAWPTPSTAPEAPNTNSNTVNGPTSLGEAATLWNTPRAYSHGQDSNPPGQVGLDQQTRSWATPQAHDGDHGMSGPNANVEGLSRQVLRTETHGELSSMSAPDTSPRYLNPRFVLALMGWPDLIGYGQEETALSPSQWRSLFGSWLERLDS